MCEGTEAVGDRCRTITTQNKLDELVAVQASISHEWESDSQRSILPFSLKKRLATYRNNSVIVELTLLSGRPPSSVANLS